MAENKISLSVAGLKLLITTPEDEEDVRKMAEELEENIQEIMTKATSASVTDAIMLCALEYLDGFNKANRAANNLRTQIKEYMGEAANAKREYDDEHKRVEEMTAELSALRSHLTRLATEGDTSGVFLKLKEEHSAVNAELARQRKRCNDLIAQQRALTEKNEAMNTYIAGQDREMARLSSVADELNLRLLEQTKKAEEWSERISWFESQIAELNSEKKRLQAELERMIAEADESDLSSKDAPAPENEEQEGLSTDFDDENTAFKDEDDAQDEPDFADAIAQINERKPVAKRPIQDYDIDISDLPLRAAPPKESEEQDIFAGYQIEENVNALGFESLRRTIEQEEIEKEPVVFEPPRPAEERTDAGQSQGQEMPEPELPAQPEVLAMSEQTELPYRPEHLGAVFENVSFESMSLEEETPGPSNAAGQPAEKKNSFLTDMIETETRRQGKRRKDGQAEDDEAMPNLSWTLDL